MAPTTIPDSRMAALSPHWGYLNTLMTRAIDEYSATLNPGVEVVRTDVPVVDPKVPAGASMERILQSSIDRDRIRLSALRSSYPMFVTGEIPEFTQSTVRDTMAAKLKDLQELELQDTMEERTSLLQKYNASEIRFDPTGKSQGFQLRTNQGQTISFLTTGRDKELQRLVDIERNMENTKFLATERALQKLVGSSDPLPGVPLFPVVAPYTLHRTSRRIQNDTIGYLMDEWGRTDEKVNAGLRDLRDRVLKTQADSIEETRRMFLRSRADREQIVKDTEMRIQNNIRLMRTMGRRMGAPARTVGFGE